MSEPSRCWFPVRVFKYRKPILCGFPASEHKNKQHPFTTYADVVAAAGKTR